MNEDRDSDDGTGRRHRLWMVLWTAVGSLATATTAVITFWQLNTSGESPPAGGGASDSAKSSEKGRHKYPALPDARISLKNTKTGMCADIPGTGRGKVNAPVQQANCIDHGDNQLWLLNEYRGVKGPKGRPVFKIVNATSALCMDLPDFGKKPLRTHLMQHPCTKKATEDNQLWWRQKKEDGYWIHNLASANRCLDVEGLAPGTPDVPLAIYRCTTGDDQAWLMREIT